MRQSRLLPFLSLGVAALPADTLVFRQQDICSYPFTTGDFAQDTKLWDETGTGSYLADILAKNGAENWSNKFFQCVYSIWFTGVHETALHFSIYPLSPFF